MKTKTYIASAALLALSAVVPTTAFSVQIVATVESWTLNDVQITGSSGSGALFTLTLNTAPFGTGIPGIDNTSQQFLAMCLEPTQTVGKGQYDWELVALESAPTTAGSGGTAPMGSAGANALMRALAALNVADLAAIESDVGRKNALQAAAWKASNPGATMTVPSDAQSLWNTLLNVMDNGNATAFPGLTVTALNNLGKHNNAGSTSGQDLFVFSYAPPGPSLGSTPEPTTVALFGLGLAGMGRYRRLRMTS